MFLDTSLRLCRVLPIGLMVILAATPPPVRAQEPLYRESFKGGTPAWTAIAPAATTPYGRSGAAIMLSTYVKDGEKARWESPSIPVAPGVYTVSGWMAANFAYTQDPGYGGSLVAILFDRDGKEIRREELVKVYKREHLDQYDFRRMPERDGLIWEYREAELKVPANAASLKVSLAWSEFCTAWRATPKNVRGEVYLDDVVVTPGPGTALPELAVEAKAELPYQLRLNTPVDINLFLPGDPLEFTARLDGPEGPPQPDTGLVLRYRVEDYQHLLVDQGQVPLARPATYFGAPAEPTKLSLLKTFYLGDTVRKEIGRWLALRVRLEGPGGKLLAEGETAFAVTSPRVLTVEQAKRSKFLSMRNVETPLPSWGQTDRWAGAAILGKSAEQNAHTGVRRIWSDMGWYTRQPTLQDPISFAKDPADKSGPLSQQEFTFEERDPLGMVIMQYMRGKSYEYMYPKGALLANPDSDGDWVDAEAFGKYVEAFVRHTRGTYYLIMSWEGHSIETWPKALRAAYAAIKRVDPRIQMVAEVDAFWGADYAKKLVDSGDINYVDCCLYDYYSTRIPQSHLEFRRYLEKRGIRKEYWNGEYNYTGSKDQEEWTRRTADFLVTAYLMGMDRISWYENHFIVPGVRAPLREGVVYGTIGMLEGQGEKISAGLPVIPQLVLNTSGYCRGNFFPFLQALMHHQIFQHFATEKLRGPLQWGTEIEGALFDGEGYSTAAVWRPTNAPPRQVSVDTGGVPFTVTDMYGRSRRVVPLQGRALITIGPDPLLFRFERRVPRFQADSDREPALALSPDPLTVAPGLTSEVQVHLRNDFGQALAGKLTLAVDAEWKIEPAARNVSLARGTAGDWTFRVTAPAQVAHGKYPLFVTLETSAGTCAWAQSALRVSAPVEVVLSEQPFTVAQPAGVIAHIYNHTGQPITGRLLVQGDFGALDRAPVLAEPVQVAPGATEVRSFLVPGWTPSFNRDYLTRALLRLDDGREVLSQRPLSFRAVVKRRAPITIDGKLDDWDLQRLPSGEFFRVFERGGASWGGYDYTYDAERWSRVKPTAVRFYSQWDEQYLYWAFVIQDDQYQGGGKGVGIAAYDALHFTVYPARVQPGVPLGGIAYKEHIGLDQDGKPTFDRWQGYLEGWRGDGLAHGVKLAIVPNAQGAILEFAVPIRDYAPVAPQAGSQFALSLLYHDADYDAEGKPSAAAMPMQWYYAITNVDMNPSRFGNFTLVE